MTAPTGTPGEGEESDAVPAVPAAPPPPPPYAPPSQYGAPPSQYGAASPYSASPGAAYASWLVRVGGYLLDSIIIGVPTVIIVVIGLAIGHGVGQALAVLAYLAAAVVGIWNVVFRQGATGQTFGKQIVGIRLIRELDGQPVGAGMSFLRQLAHFLDSLACYLGWLWPLWDAKNQTFADKLCSTVVIKV
jgi:uncharacterized RDD family membrane protein YckC